MNATWHSEHPMPARATLAQRAAWHLAHAKACGCRPIPKTVQAYLAGRSAATPAPREAPRAERAVLVPESVRDAAAARRRGPHRPRLRPTPATALATTLLVLSACHHASGSRESAHWARLSRRCPPDAPASSLSAARRDSLPPVPTGNGADGDDRWVRLARTVPGGFGGYFLRSSDGRETIYLKEPEKRSEALAALNARPVTGTTIGADAIVMRGRWDYVQLYEWYRYLVPRLWGTRLVSTDLDEGENRILLGVEDEPSRRRLEARLVALHVPCFLVAIEVEPPPRSVSRRAAVVTTAAAPAARRPSA